MLDLKVLPLTKIYVAPKRLRAVDEDQALAIQAEIVAGQFIDPVTVYRTTRRGEKSYTLIDGAHRLRAMELLGETEIPCVVVSADKDTAELMEAGANLFRHLTALDRAIAIHAYRCAWERKHGPIARGGDQSAKISLCSIDTISDEASRGFSVQCAERLGMSKRAVEMAVQIAKCLPGELIDRLRGTAIADNQSQLLKLAGLPGDQLALSARLFDLAEGDFGLFLVAVSSHPDRQEAAIDHCERGNSLASFFGEAEKIADDNKKRLQAYSRIVEGWGRIAAAEKWQVMSDFGVIDIFTDEQLRTLADRFGGPRPISDDDV